ncbi:MAG TPA: hypothetical protein VFV74_00385 [Burkholderiales bacterium]|nr:hypothetical protein [Burkholderiales bacterium]
MAQKFSRQLKRLAAGAWAPVVVVLVSFPLSSAPFAESIYPVLHIAGGAALAYFFRRTVRLFYTGWPPLLSSLVAFSLACTGALAWEIAEFGIDFVFGTTLQEGLLDTMTDLILACAGAGAWLALRRGVQDLAPAGTVRMPQATDRHHHAESAENRTAPRVAKG